MNIDEHGNVPPSGDPRDSAAGVGQPLLRLAPATRRCPSCGATVTGDDTYCTSCGRGLIAEGNAAADTLVSVPEPERTLIAATPPQRDSPTPVGAHGRVWIGRTLAVLAGLFLIGVIAFGALWHSERDRAARLQDRLDQTTLTLRQTRATLTSTRAKLAATNALSAKRRAVLLNAQQVLKNVDPLLSSVDGVQQRAGDLQGQGTTLSDDAESMIQTTVTLVNYLVDWGSNADTAYVNSLIDEANSELNAVRADEVLFAGNTSDYDKASTKFGQQADAFSTAVRSLQQRLRGVEAP